MISTVYPCSSRIGFAISRISACGAALAPITMVLSSFPLATHPDTMAANVTVVTTNANNLFSFLFPLSLI